ncbi:heparan-alpha-glucosaminide N-acetyltransferase [Acuticoccus sp.]|uniref:heparan-alpha-glucosaminide N-acetyltransferase n=1 Tax=Acuticoccus sp. TaxID=1904378 RepID=UPI003B516BF9
MALLTGAAPLAPTRSQRIPWLDAARGVAILAMVAYHGAFDLAFFGHVDWPVASHPLWRAFAAGIASTFLFLVGVSLVAAHGERVRWRAFARRLAIVGAGAAAVTVGTVATMPAPIYFGILHAIALFSVLALPFLRAPVGLTLAAAATVFALPFVVSDEAFLAPWAYPLGLAPHPPVTFDYEPVFPWLAVTLCGVALGRVVPLHPALGRSPWGFLALLGRWSLVIYLVHQPALFAVLMAVDALM